MDSKLLTAIDEAIGKPLDWPVLFLVFPPILLMSPVLLLVWASISMERVTPMVSMSLLEAALESERDELTAVICRSKGHPTRFALTNLRSRLARKAEAALDGRCLAKLKVLCK